MNLNTGSSVDEHMLDVNLTLLPTINRVLIAALYSSTYAGPADMELRSDELSSLRCKATAGMTGETLEGPIEIYLLSSAGLLLLSLDKYAKAIASENVDYEQYEALRETVKQLLEQLNDVGNHCRPAVLTHFNHPRLCGDHESDLGDAPMKPPKRRITGEYRCSIVYELPSFLQQQQHWR